MEKRTIIFLLISFVILGCYPLVLQHFYPDYYKNHSKTSLKKSADSSSASSSKNETPDGPSDVLGKFSSENDQIFENKDLKLVFNKLGAGIREVSFSKFIDSDTKKPLLFISLENPSGSSTLVRLMDKPSSDAPASSSYEMSSSGGQIEASAVQNGIKIKKSYDFKEGQYSGDLHVQFENTTDSPIEFRYQIFAGSSIAPRHSIDSQYIEGNFFSRAGEKTFLKHIKESKAGKSVESEGFVE